MIMRVTTFLFASALLAHGEALWPEFRGPTAQGHSSATDLPIKWTKSKGVKWRTEIEGLGWSSPVVANGKVFVTNAVTAGASSATLEVIAFDASTGTQVWRTEVFQATDPALLRMHKENSHASPTPVYESGLLYAHFSQHGTACLKEDGTVLWRVNEHPYAPVHGTGGSPVIVDDLLIYNADGASEPAVIALNKLTGRTAWKVSRTSAASRKFSFSTPLVIEGNGRPQLITAGSGVVQALNPKNGEEIWRCTYDQGYSVVPRPIFAHGMIYVATGYDKPTALAIKVEGARGDVTDSHIVWRADKRIPHNPSMVILGDDLYMIDDKGLMSCRDAKTGSVHYEERLLGPTWSSLLYADGHLYVIDKLGTTAVVKPGHTLQVVAKNDLDEKTQATLAVVDSDLLIRTEKALYRITR
jgi:outer membrane protein assembly factor BamB